MVSFCDIPLSQTQEHVMNYGNYALGFDKQWGMKKNISPVHYIYKDSICARVIREVYRALPEDAFNQRCGCLQFNAQTAIFYYGKPYRGKMLRQPEKDDVTFYNEREWRYVPFADQTIKEREKIPADVRPMLSEREYGNSQVLLDATTSLHRHYRLTFAAKDVKYLIVENEEEIPEIVDFIYDQLGEQGENTELRHCSQNDKKRLTTRVLSLRQIKQDF
jgi:Putative abortive phage resistance protein AbiGi, antitoxin